MIKFSKRSWIGLSAVIGTAVLGTAALKFARGDAQAEPDAGAGAEETVEAPTSEPPMRLVKQEAGDPPPAPTTTSFASPDSSNLNLDPANSAAYSTDAYTTDTYSDAGSSGAYAAGATATGASATDSYAADSYAADSYAAEEATNDLRSSDPPPRPPSAPYSDVGGGYSAGISSESQNEPQPGYQENPYAQTDYAPRDAGGYQAAPPAPGGSATYTVAASESASPAQYGLSDYEPAASEEPLRQPEDTFSGGYPAPTAGNPAASAPYAPPVTNPLADQSASPQQSIGYPNSGATPAPPSHLAAAESPSMPAAPQFDPTPEGSSMPVAPQFDPAPEGSWPARTTEPGLIAQPPPDASSVPQESTSLVQATPGSRQLEGVQAPALEIEKLGPEEIQINIPATYQIKIRNVGRATAHGVSVTDRVPNGTEYVDTMPEAMQLQGLLLWQFESLAPGEEQTISMKVLPKAEGNIGSVAQVSFQSQASVRSLCTRPALKVEHEAPEKVLIGDDVVFSITISNPGSGAATGVVIEEDVPEGLEHAAGRLLESEIGTLEPGESRQMELVVKAASARMVRNTIRVRGNGGVQDSSFSDIEVVAPDLAIRFEGPTRRYLERQVAYELLFQNPGTAAARNVELAAYLPKGLQFQDADNKGQYDSRNHAVFWSLAELPPGENGRVKIQAMPVEIGDQTVRAEAKADLVTVQPAEHTMQVEAITELEFSVADLHDPIEVGSQTTYEVRVVNNGVTSATDVQIVAILPPEIEALKAEGTTQVVVSEYSGQGQQVQMQAIPELPPRGEAVYRINVRGRRHGDHVIDVRIRSKEAPTVVTKQEGTRVYSDQ